MRKLLFKQKFAWFGKYHIFDEHGQILFTVHGEPSWGRKLRIYDKLGGEVALLKQEVMHLMPQFAMYVGGHYIGKIKKEFTWFKPSFKLDCSGWQVTGDVWQWDYNVVEPSGRLIMHASKELWNLMDTYTITVMEDRDTLLSLMIVLAIDAAKETGGN